MTAQESLDDPLLRECYARSIQLLKDNSHDSGVIAAAPEPKAVDRNYASIFGRDAAICSLGMVVSGDRELVRHAKKSLMTLARHQAGNGQIPKYVKPEKGEVDFWYSGCIDATLWWLIAVHFYDRQRPADGLAKQLQDKVKRAFTWLFCQEHQGIFLLQQNEASDWADIMPRSGFVLYTNTLWHLVKELYGVPTFSKTRQCFKHLFFPFDKPMAKQRRARIMAEYVKKKVPWSDVYLSFVNFSFWGRDVDVFGNILACLFGIPEKAKSERIVDALIKRRANRPHPVRVMLDPIRKSSQLWRPYMERHDLNLPNQYHNGGGWPFVAGFWVMLLKDLGRTDLAWKELMRMAEANKVKRWGFYEWFHGRTGKAMGMRGQSWNASMFILAWHALKENIALR